MGFFDIFTTDAQDAAAESQKAGLNAGYTQASGLLGQGRDALTTNYAAALQPFNTALTQATTTGTKGYDAYADASGANGPEGLARAKQNFQATPGYSEGLNMGLDQNDRRAASRGMLGSGNTSADTIKFANDYASQKYGQYTAGLSPYTNNPAQITGIASGMAGVNTGLGNALNQSYGQQASSAYGTQTGIGNANANADLANLTASQNIWGAAMNGAKLAASTFSDERLKEDIEQVGELFDGQPVYRYSYAVDPDRTHIGLLAQEVEEVAPDAVSEHYGFKAVDYRKATDFAAALREAA